MGLLLDDNNDVASLGAGELISFSVEGVLLVVRATLVDLGRDNLLLLAHLLSIAGLTLVLLVDHLSLAATVIARSLTLRVHSGSQLHHLGDHSAASAGSTSLDGALFASFAVALGADPLSVHGNLRLFPGVDFLKGHLQLVNDWFTFLRSGLLGASAATHSKHLTKKIIHASSVCTALFESILAILIVQVPLVFITKYLIGLLDLLELFLVTTSVGVIFKSQFSI